MVIFLCVLDFRFFASNSIRGGEKVFALLQILLFFLFFMNFNISDPQITSDFENLSNYKKLFSDKDFIHQEKKSYPSQYSM